MIRCFTWKLSHTARQEFSLYVTDVDMWKLDLVDYEFLR